MHRLSPFRVRRAMALAVAATAALDCARRRRRRARGPRAHRGRAAPTAKAARLHDDMRKLWEDHITWTRLAIVSFAGGLPDLEATDGRLLQNQVDIGERDQAFYGAPRQRLTDLLRTHHRRRRTAGGGQIRRRTPVGQAQSAWYQNGEQIAGSCSDANPR